ncbi:GbsR/MarR family transcriptional regulator [Actinomadura rugatobispora]|uniref:GbsR/MarR family transcriptional regulator n=1 Tax=Actinomadura rugatobispora TaxID=1994 RepID=A0ABW1A6K4_9ACTN|nr:MarR family transcriptional regulator [Actinomadura rugatobispora]
MSSEDFVEEAGLYFERLGLSRTAGRVMGVLLLSDDDGMDLPELREELGAAKSSISVAVGRLAQAGLVERFRRPGARRDRYRLTRDVFGRAFRSKMAEFQRFQELAEHGLAVVGDDPRRRERLENMRDMYAFMAEGFPRLLAEWERTRQAPSHRP